MLRLTLPYNWSPRPLQANLWHYLMNDGKRASVCWHRRFGKDDVSLHWTACAAHMRVGSYWHMLPEKEQARKAIWTMVNPHTGKKRIDEAFPVELRARTNDQEMFIEFKNGSTWQIAGSDNYNSLVGSSPCGVVFSEYALADPAAWAYIRPILRENKGWAIFISTPRGKNHFYNLHQHAHKEAGWFAETLTVEDTKIISESDLAADLRELQAEHGDDYGKSIWMQENYCSFEAAVAGAFWSDSLDRVQVRGGFEDFEVDPRLPVFTAFDLGRTDDTAIWFYQIKGEQIDVFEYFGQPGYEILDEDAPDKSLVHVLLRNCEKYKTKIRTNWVPHDARPRRLGMGGKSILQQFQDAAKKYPQIGNFAVVPKLDVQEGIQAARKTFQHCRFHKTNTETGVNCLRNYRREWDPELRKYNDNPVHDWASHGADGFRYLSLSWKFSKAQQPEVPLMERILKNNPTGITMGQLRDQHFRERRAAREWAGAA